MKITIIGAGAMGGAMAEGLLQSEKFTPSDVAPRGKAIDKVSTPGGCTIKGLFAMEQKAIPTLSLRA